MHARHISRLHAASDEGAGELVSAGVQLGIGEGGGAIERSGDCDSIGPGFGLGLNPGHD